LAAFVAALKHAGESLAVRKDYIRVVRQSLVNADPFHACHRTHLGQQVYACFGPRNTPITLWMLWTPAAECALFRSVFGVRNAERVMAATFRL